MKNIIISSFSREKAQQSIQQGHLKTSGTHKTSGASNPKRRQDREPSFLDARGVFPTLLNKAEAQKNSQIQSEHLLYLSTKSSIRYLNSIKTKRMEGLSDNLNWIADSNQFNVVDLLSKDAKNIATDISKDRDLVFYTPEILSDLLHKLEEPLVKIGQCDISSNPKKENILTLLGHLKSLVITAFKHVQSQIEQAETLTNSLSTLIDRLETINYSRDSGRSMALFTNDEISQLRGKNFLRINAEVANTNYENKIKLADHIAAPSPPSLIFSSCASSSLRSSPSPATPPPTTPSPTTTKTSPPPLIRGRRSHARRANNEQRAIRRPPSSDRTSRSQDRIILSPEGLSRLENTKRKSDASQFVQRITERMQQFGFMSKRNNTPPPRSE